MPDLPDWARLAIGACVTFATLAFLHALAVALRNQREFHSLMEEARERYRRYAERLRGSEVVDEACDPDSRYADVEILPDPADEPPERARAA